jgi:hypothetical protein
MRQKDFILGAFAETWSRDFGSIAINMNGGYRTCGGFCDIKQDTSGNQEWCVSAAKGEGCSANSGCSCHMYDTGGSNDMKDWKHIWKPGDTKPVISETHRCVCVK